MKKTLFLGTTLCCLDFAARGLGGQVPYFIS